MSKQVNLHQHLEFSFLDGAARPEEVASRANELGQRAVAITDHGEVSGHWAFQKACRAQGVHPLLGIEAYWVDSITEAKGDGKRYPSEKVSHICLIAQDQKGLENIWALSSEAYSDKYRFHKPWADPELLRQYSDGVFASDGCLMTVFAQKILAGDEEGARQIFAGLADIYGDRFYSELHTWGYMNPRDDDEIDWFGRKATTAQANADMAAVNQAKVEFANKMGVPLVVVNDSHHARPEDWQRKELIWKLNTRGNPDQSGSEGQKSDHLMGEDELYFWMARHGIGRGVVAQAIDNSWDIAQSCTAEVLPTLSLPVFTRSERDDAAKLLDLVEQGFKDKVVAGGLDVEAYWKRMESEVRLIVDRNFSGYFLTVRDYVRAARTGTWKQYVVPGAAPDPMITGPSRGSAGGCLVSWLLGITAVDPIKYGLLFERFLNPARKGMPDIDVDVPREKRPGIKDYLAARWGHDHVCTLGSITRNGPRGMLRDLGRVDKVPYGDIDQMSKLVERAAEIVASNEGDAEDGGELNWDQILSEKGGELIPWVQKYPHLFERVGELTGIARQSGVHASGILINNEPLTGLIPTRIKNATLTTQFDMWDIEASGGVKFDLLGIRHLDTIDAACRLIEERHGFDLEIDTFDDRQMSDPEIWGQIDRGHTLGIFHVESPLATRVAMELRPRNERDVAALLSIIRPGVKDAGLMDTYLRRRKGDEPVLYDHPLLEPITRETFGVLVYQESLLLAAQSLAGFTPGEADDLRKALGKKLAEEIAGMEGKFLEGCLANPAFMEPLGEDTATARRVAQNVWTSISAAGRYAFCKAHAIGYAILATWEVWVKHYYPEEFLVALLQTDPDNTARYIQEARRRGIVINPPDVNRSDLTFTIDGDGIRYGLTAIRGVGANSVKGIVNRAPYRDFADFLKRGSSNKTVVNNLIRIGAFDAMEYNPAFDGDWVPSCRSRLMSQFNNHRLWMDVAEGKRAKMDDLERAIHLDGLWIKRREQKGQAWIDAEYGIENFDDPAVVQAIETELVGTFILADPLGPYQEALEGRVVRDPSDLEDVVKGTRVVVGGQITKVKTHTIAKGRMKGQEMAFLGILYNGAEFDVTVFCDQWAQSKNLLPIGAPVAMEVERDDRGVHLIQADRLDLILQQRREP